MHRFLLQQNIARLAGLLQNEPSLAERREIMRALHAEKKALALLDAATFGLHPGTIPMGRDANGTVQEPEKLRRFRNRFEAAGQPYLLLDPRAGLHIVDANGAYQSATMTSPGICGRTLFEVFPDNPADPGADGVSNLFTSLREAALCGEPRQMRIQRYDIRNGAGDFVKRYWRPVNTPIFDDNARLAYLLHHVEDVTATVRATR